MQIIVVDSEPQLGAPGLNGIQYIPCPDCPSIPHARALGVQFASAPIVAFLEDHCVAQPGWAPAVASAFAANPNIAVVAYAFENLNPVNWISRSCAVLAFGPWMAPVPSGPIEKASCTNVAYRKEILAGARSLAQWFTCEDAHLEALRRSGVQFWQAGEARVKHLNHPCLPGLVRNASVWQRLIAATRVQVGNWPWPRRILHAIAAVPCSPLIIIWRLGRSLWGRKEIRRQFIVALPLMYFFYTWGAFSEALGYVAGSGNAARRTFEIETGDPRGEPL